MPEREPRDDPLAHGSRRNDATCRGAGSSELLPTLIDEKLDEVDPDSFTTAQILRVVLTTCVGL